MTDKPVSSGGFSDNQLKSAVASIDRPRFIVALGGGDNTSAINDAITEATAAASAQNHASIVWPSGEYDFATPVSIPDYIDHEGASCRLHYNGLDLTQPVITVGSGNASNRVQGHLPEIICDVQHDLNTILDPNGLAWASGSYGNGPDYDNFCGYRIQNGEGMVLKVGSVQNFPIGVQFALTRQCGYNHFIFQSILRCRVAIDVYGTKEAGTGAVSGWFNQNILELLNVAATSSLWGSCYAVRFRPDPTGSGGYDQHNANYFPAASIQLLDGDSSGDVWSGATSYIAGRLIRAGGNEYRAAAAVSSGGSEPTHTSGTVSDWEYVGKYRRSTVFFDEAGQDAKFDFARLETGYGAPILGRSNTGNFGDNTRLEASYVVNTDSDNPTGGVQTDVEIIDAEDSAEIITAAVTRSGQPEAQWTSVDFSRSLQSNAGGWTTPGVIYFHRTTSELKAIAVPADGAGLLTKSGLHRANSSAGVASFVVPLNEYVQQWELNYGLTDVSTRFYAYALDDTKTKLAHLEATPLMCGKAFMTSTDSINSLKGNANSHGHQFVRSLDASVKWLVLGGDNGIFGTLAVRPVLTRALKFGATPTLSPLNLFGSDTRYSDGVPVVGHFPRIGEQIENLNGTTAGWRVTASGMLAQAWAETTMIAGEYRTNAAKVYAHAGGAASATPPTHTSGTVDDWEFITSDIATLATL